MRFCSVLYFFFVVRLGLGVGVGGIAVYIAYKLLLEYCVFVI